MSDGEPRPMGEVLDGLGLVGASYDRWDRIAARGRDADDERGRLVVAIRRATWHLEDAKQALFDPGLSDVEGVERARLKVGLARQILGGGGGDGD